jgi:hypothetical protein
MKDDRVRVAPKVHDHDIGLKCLKCGGKLNDTIINFGEYLAPEVCTDANRHGGKADTLLVLGSSLRVITCDALSDIEEHGGNLIIVNKQITPYDAGCAIRIFADCDVVMQMLMKELALPIPPPNINRYFKLDWTKQAKEGIIEFQGTDETYATPFAICVKGIELRDGKDVIATATHSAEWHKPLLLKGVKGPLPAKLALAMKMNPLRNEGECVIDMGTIVADGAKTKKTQCTAQIEFDDSMQVWSLVNVSY